MLSIWTAAIQRLRRIWRTLRFRLTLVNAFSVALTSLVMLGIVRQGVEWALYHELDQVLQEDLQEASLAIEQSKSGEFRELQEEFTRKALGHRQHGWFIQLTMQNSQELWSSDSTPPELNSPRLIGNLQPLTIDRLRVITAELPANRLNIRQIRVGSRLDFLDNDMRRIDRLVLSAAMMLIIVAPLCGYWLAGRAARTIGDIIHTASRLRPTHLDERLKLRGTGDELDQLAYTINGLLDRIGAYLQQRRDFLANAAHELRTPLAAIRSSVEVAMNKTGLSSDQANMLEDLIDQSMSLEVLVNQLLVLTETEMGQWAHDSENVALHEIVSRAVDMFQGVSEENGLTLQLGPVDPVTVSGSRRYLRQVVNNLIDNAVKYTPSGGSIQVELRAIPEERIGRLTIRDTGIGISEQDLPKVFDRFFRADRSRTRSDAIQGTGLGLSICQSVVHAHQGTIRCESLLNQGTMIEITLPLVSVVPEVTRERSAS